MPQASISLTFSRHFSLSFIASGKSSGLQPVSSHSFWMYVRASRPDFARPYVGVHRSTSLMSSSLLLQQSPASLVRLTWIAFVMGGRWPYSWCLVGCCHQDLFNIARKILVQLPSLFKTDKEPGFQMLILKILVSIRLEPHNYIFGTLTARFSYIVYKAFHLWKINNINSSSISYFATYIIS